jgi:hypothetical protein
MTGRFARLSVVIAAGLSLLVGGCDSSGDPGTLPSVSGSSSGSPSGSASASASPSAVPTPPAAARKPTSAGASEFVRFYIDLINEAYRTGASEPLRAYADDQCDSCSSIADAVDDIYSTGSARGGEITPISVTAAGLAPGVTPTVVVDARISKFEQLDLSATVTDTVQARTDTLFFELVWRQGSWFALAIRNEAGTT